MTKPYAISLVLHQEGPTIGWRVHIHSPLNENSQEYSVAIKQAEDLGRSITDVLTNANPTPFMVVRDGTAAMRATLENELKEAETRAASIATLRRTLAEMDQ